LEALFGLLVLCVADCFVAVEPREVPAKKQNNAKTGPATSAAEQLLDLRWKEIITRN
jgi:hypothetical protein